MEINSVISMTLMESSFSKDLTASLSLILQKGHAVNNIAAPVPSSY